VGRAPPFWPQIDAPVGQQLQLPTGWLHLQLDGRVGLSRIRRDFAALNSKMAVTAAIELGWLASQQFIFLLAKSCAIL